MLSISPPMTGGGRGDYYLSLAREDYYIHGGEPPGRWFGKSAEAMGLVGIVDAGALRDLLDGFAPGRERPLVQNAGHPDRQSGWDLTFSAPKSVSVLWSQARDDVRAEIQTAQDEAVKAALGYLEQETGYTRRGKAGGILEKVGFIAARFEHGTSRAQDPQLHTHTLVLNIGARDDGTTGTIVSELFFRHKMAAGALYRAELAQQLVNRLGLEMRMTETSFEVAHVSEALIREFSKRRAAVEKALLEKGKSGPVAAKIAALDTRGRKQAAPRNELFQTWQEVGRKRGWSLMQAMALPWRRGKPAEPINKNEIEDILTKLTHNQSHFATRDLVRKLAELGEARNLGAADILELKTSITAKLESLGEFRSERHFTTKEMRKLEDDLYAVAQAGKAVARHQIGRRTVEEVLNGKKLSPEQLEAVRHITETPGTIKVVAGLAGTGKSTMLSAAREVWEKAGKKVVGVALSGKAAEGLEDSAQIKSFTIAHTLKELDRSTAILPGVSLTVRETKIAPHAPKRSPLHGVRVPYIAFEVGGVQLNDKTVLVVDEAGMVGTRQLKALLDKATAANAKVVLVGDAKQLPAIEAGSPFRALGRILGTTELTDIQRQAEPWAREVVRSFAEGDTGRALAALAERGFVHVTPERNQAVDKLIKDWHKAGDPKENLILTSTNTEARTLNAAAQKARRMGGMLSTRGIEHEGERFHVGDRILCGRNSRLYGVKNGSLGSVVSIKEQVLHVHLDNGRKARLPLKHYEHVRLGYAVTTHKGQGVTTGNAFVLMGESMQGREMSYVQASRARHETNIYIDEALAGEDLADLQRRMHASQAKRMASDINTEKTKVREEEERRRESERKMEREQQERRRRENSRSQSI